MTLMVLLAVGVADAAPLTFTHQGRLLDAGGAPVIGTHSVTLTLYDAANAVKWQDATSGVVFQDGFFSVTLGTDDTGRTLEQAFHHASPATTLGVALDAGAEYTPRSPLAATPRAATASGVTVGSGLVGTACPGPGAVAHDTTANALVLCTGATWTAVGVQTPVALTVSGNSGQAMGAGTKIVFTTTVLDTHSGYSNGTYTCPMSGYYRVSWQLYSVNWSSADWDVGLYRDGTVLVRDDTGIRNPSLSRSSNRGSIVLSCNATQTLELRNISARGSQSIYASGVDNWLSIEKI
jgi:hypothetical protein